MESKFSNNKSNCSSDYKLNLISEHLKDPKYKTEMCKNFVKYGKCSYKKKCRYAHGDPELISKNLSNKNYKRNKCNNFHAKPGHCPYGRRCQYVHEDRNLEDIELVHFNFYQTLIKKNEYEKFMYIRNEIIQNARLSRKDQKMEFDLNKELKTNCNRLSVFSEITSNSNDNHNSRLPTNNAIQTQENSDYCHKRSDNCSTHSNSIDEVPDYYNLKSSNNTNNCNDNNSNKFSNKRGLEYNDFDYKYIIRKTKMNNNNANINYLDRSNLVKNNWVEKFSLFKKQQL
jgi:hypothetical protein